MTVIYARAGEHAAPLHRLKRLLEVPRTEITIGAHGIVRIPIPGEEHSELSRDVMAACRANGYSVIKTGYET